MVGRHRFDPTDRGGVRTHDERWSSEAMLRPRAHDCDGADRWVSGAAPQWWSRISTMTIATPIDVVTIMETTWPAMSAPVARAANQPAPARTAIPAALAHTNAAPGAHQPTDAPPMAIVAGSAASRIGMECRKAWPT